MKKKVLIFVSLVMFFNIILVHAKDSKSPNKEIEKLSSAIAVESDPEKKARLYAERALVYIYIKELALAMNDITAANDLKPMLYETSVAMAYISYDMDEFEFCIELIDRLVASSDEMPELHHLKGAALSKLNKPLDAIKAYNIAIEMSNEPKGTHYLSRGISYFSLYFKLLRLNNAEANNYLNLAYNDFIKAIQLEPNSLPAYEYVAYCAYTIKDYEKAIYYSQEGIKIDPTKAVAFYLTMVYSYINLKKYDEAQKNLNTYFTFSQKLRRESIDKNAKLCQVLIYVKTNKLKEGISQISELISRDGKDPFLYYVRAHLYFKESKNKRIKKEKEKYLSLCKNDLYKSRELGFNFDADKFFDNPQALDVLFKENLHKMIEAY